MQQKIFLCHYGVHVIYSYHLQSSMFLYLCRVFFHLKFMLQKILFPNFSVRLLAIEEQDVATSLILLFSNA
jgi:hypothetical protein